MTRALQTLNDAEDIGEDKETPSALRPVKATNPVIQTPASANPSKLAAAIEAARAAKIARDAKTAEERDKLDESLQASDPPRDELNSQAEAMMQTLVTSPEAAEVARELSRMLGNRQEMERNVRQALGVTIPEIADVGDNLEEHLRGLVSANAAMREAIRMICAAAGTVRIDEYIPVKREGGGIFIKRQYVDVGDEEGDQDPILDLKWLLPAALKVEARFRRLRQEHTNAVGSSASANHQLTITQHALAERDRDLVEANKKIALLNSKVKDDRPAAPGTPTGFFLKSEDGKWVGLYTGKRACFVNKWMTVANVQDAHAFAFKQDAQETLGRLQFTRVHRIGKAIRGTLRVVTVSYEDHSE